MYLTCTFVEFASLCNVPSAEPGPLSNRGPDSVHIVTGQDGVQEDSSVWDKSQTWAVYSTDNQLRQKKETTPPRGRDVRFRQNPLGVQGLFFLDPTSVSAPWYFIDSDNLSLGFRGSLLLSSHGDAPMNDRHVQTERPEWGLWPVPAGSVEPAPECQ